MYIQLQQQYLQEDITKILPLLKEQIEKSQKIAVFWHQNVDGDAVGSMLWFWRLLEKLGKTVSYFTTVQPVYTYDFIPGIEKIKTDFDHGQYDLIVFLDFSIYERIDLFTQWVTSQGSSASEYFDSIQKVMIDHHISDQTYPNSFIIRDITSSSTCGLAFEIISSLRPEHLDNKIATSLLLGVYTDTWNFMRSKNTERDFDIAKNLIHLWADKDFLIKEINYSSKPALIPMATKILQRATIIWDIIYTRYTDKELEELDISDDEIEQAHGLLRSIKWILVFLRLRKEGDERRWSLRSWWDNEWNRVSVEQIARSFKVGWWHKRASWFSEDVVAWASIEQELERIVSKIQTEINKQK